ncbi:MAG: GNAT family N-acetyltransferase [Candidatus Promineifilaceae bacterium]|nr:GNAT family N-acetyltransferase [Candidatus Promineifilaceae bacterium]
MSIVQVETAAQRDAVRSLFGEYLNWANQRVQENFGVSFDIETILNEDMADLEKFTPPDGRLLLAAEDDEVAGVACLHRIGPTSAEIKRMYVREAFRGRGLGRALLDALVEEARLIGYRRLRLDSARFMHAAHALYRSSGFVEIEPYAASEIPDAFRQHWIFMERAL